MAVENSPTEVFRFIQFGPPRPLPVEPRLQRTQFYITLESQSPVDRVRMANSVLGGSSREVARSAGDLALGPVFTSALERALADPAATIATLVAALPEGVPASAEFPQDLKRLSDTLLLSAFATAHVPPALDELRRLFLAYLAVEAAAASPQVAAAPLPGLLGQPVVPSFVEAKKLLPPVRSVGVADLLVVKQQIKRYEAAEIAHVENVMPGETRARRHRQLERFEETLTRETEASVEKEEELETSERFELQRETSRTIKEDQKYAFDLSVSGKYGPVVEFDTSFGMEVSLSDETQSRNATTYAKDVVQRSMERVTERVREERIRRITRETEEKNLHSFVNDSGESVRGIYQFLDRIYEAQIFNYGKRAMFDLMVPEPASYLWHLERAADTRGAALPAPPDPLEIDALDILHDDDDHDDERHYARLAAKYGATGLDAPPPAYRRASVKHQHPAGTEGSGGPSEGGSVLAPNSVLELEIPDGYRPRSARLYGLGLTDNVTRFYIALAFARSTTNLTFNGNNRLHVGGNDLEGQIYIVRDRTQYTFTNVEGETFAPGSKLHLAILPFETGNFSVMCEVLFERTESLVADWQAQTWSKLRSAYQDRLLEHKDEVARIQSELKNQAEADDRKIGAPPSQRRQTILTELKKHCIAILRQQWYTEEPPVSAEDGEPPTFDFAAARRWGSVVRFLEHAFEWDQVQYAFYPYFWARRAEWEARFRKDDPDYDFQQFLQAGAARVVVPARRGFEAAVAYFLETGEPWEGRGEPALSDPLYLSIVDEIRERTGGRLDAVVVGEPWEVRMPTSLILLRRQDARPELPAWERVEGGSWEWRPVVG